MHLRPYLLPANLLNGGDILVLYGDIFGFNGGYHMRCRLTAASRVNVEVVVGCSSD